MNYNITNSITDIVRISLWMSNQQTHVSHFGIPIGIANFHLNLKYLHGIFTRPNRLFLNA